MPKGRKTGSTNKWKPADVAAEQDAVKALLEAARASDGAAGRLALAMRELQEADGDQTPRGAVRRYVLAVSALVHHERYGGLTMRQARQVFETGMATLRVEGLSPASPRHAYLFADLHQALSMVYRKYGHPENSMWQLLLARRHARTGGDRAPHQQALALAIRAARLGDTELALREYAAAADAAPSEAFIARCRIGEAKILRAAGRLDEAAQAHAALRDCGALDATAEREVAWERLALHAQAEGDLAPMMRSIRSRGTHHAGVFLLEAHLWAYAAPTLEWSRRLKSLASAAKDASLRLARRGALFRFALIRESLEDTEVPFEHRLAGVGKLLPRRSQLLSIDQEALALASLARWFARWRLPDFAGYFLAEYRGICLRLSGGASDDTLRLADDLRREDA